MCIRDRQVHAEDQTELLSPTALFRSDDKYYPRLPELPYPLSLLLDLSSFCPHFSFFSFNNPSFCVKKCTKNTGDIFFPFFSASPVFLTCHIFKHSRGSTAPISYTNSASAFLPSLLNMVFFTALKIFSYPVHLHK